MSQWTGRYALVVPDANREDANNTFHILDPDTGGDQTFSVPLNASGDPADATTHWGAYSPLPTEIREALTTLGTQDFKTFVDSLAEQKGRTSLGSVLSFRAKVDISAEGEDFWEFTTGLGLQRVQSSEQSEEML